MLVEATIGRATTTATWLRRFVGAVFETSRAAGNAASSDQRKTKRTLAGCWGGGAETDGFLGIFHAKQYVRTFVLEDLLVHCGKKHGKTKLSHFPLCSSVPAPASAAGVVVVLVVFGGCGCCWWLLWLVVAVVGDAVIIMPIVVHNTNKYKYQLTSSIITVTS